MAMCLQALNAALDRGFGESVDQAAVAALVEGVTAHAGDGGLRQRCAALSEDDGAADPLGYNVLCAGLLGLVPGAAALRPVEGGPSGYRVNRFLHDVRKAVLNCPALEGIRRDNSRHHIFYPEFVALGGLRSRIAAVARAHAGMGPRDEELAVLFALGGRFAYAEASKAARAVISGGGACVMAARALYHAAGCGMVGRRTLTLNTPLGANVELGAPLPVAADGNAGAGDATASTAGRDRPPALEVGDIYLLDGDGEPRYVIRGSPTPAGHVGIVVERDGETLQTVDGGAGLGGDIRLSRDRTLYFKAGVGWAFADCAPCYSNAEIIWIDREMLPYASDAGIQAAIATDPLFAGVRDELARAQRDFDAAANDRQREQHRKSLAAIFGTARRLKRQAIAAQVGEVPTLHGRWTPDRYPALLPVTSALVRCRLAGS